jgi:hypothetical protein
MLSGAGFRQSASLLRPEARATAQTKFFRRSRSEGISLYTQKSLTTLFWHRHEFCDPHFQTFHPACGLMWNTTVRSNGQP